MSRITDFVGRVVGDNSVTLKHKNTERVDDGIIYTWEVTILQFNDGNPRRIAKNRVKARSIARAVRSGESTRRIPFLERYTRVYTPKVVDSADFTTVYEYEAKVLTG